MSYSRRLLWILSSSLMLASCISLPGRAAEKVTVSYGPFGRSLKVSDLREYSETGRPPRELASLLSVIGKEERASLLTGLKFKVPLNVVVMDKLLRSPQGDQILTQIAGATSLPGGAEKLALRSALIGAAASKDGLGILSFLEAYPTQRLKINVPEAQKLLKSGSSLLGGFMGGQFPGGETPPTSPTDPSDSPSDTPEKPSEETTPTSEESAPTAPSTESAPTPEESAPTAPSEETPPTPEESAPADPAEN